MRSILLFCALSFAGTLAAQNYTQNAPPMQQVQQAADCYTRNLDNGNAALRRGEMREALRLFNEAKNCPDAQGNSRRQAELDTRIARCEEQLGTKKTIIEKVEAEENKAPIGRRRVYSTELPSTRRNYTANRDFVKDTVNECFGRMVDEANRAFRLKFWEDAAALYRAAKNCADADQKARQQMSDKITECRNAAENELFAKQQEAERQARHAIAANLADDAEELLRSTDRSLAFRLADFANQYVAPEDNLDCVQAMFDAWYYQPSEDTKHRESELYHPAFCYELADNLGENTQVKFKQQKDGSQWLWAFVPEDGELSAWKMPSMELVQSYNTGEGNGYLGFDFSPDGELIFWGNRFFDLRRGTKSVRVEVPMIANWCFNGRGDEFFYQNVEDQKIYLLDVHGAFAQQQYATRKGSRNPGNPELLQLSVKREIVSGLPEGLMAMKYVEGKFWLGYSDRVDILGKEAPGKPWKVEKTFRFEGITIPDFVEPKDLHLQLYPKESMAVLSYEQGAWSIPLTTNPESKKTEAKAKAFPNMAPLAISPSTHQMACQYVGNYLYSGFWIMNSSTGDTLLRQHVPSYTSFNLLSGSFSSDANWVAAASYYGNVNVWALQENATVRTTQLPQRPSDKPIFSPDGRRLFATFGDTLSIFNTNKPFTPTHTWKGLGAPLSGASDQWAMFQVTMDSAEAIHLTSGRRLRFPLPNPSSNSFSYDFDSKGEKLMAYMSDWNKVEVRSLKTGAMLASKVFDGGTISEIHFIPGSDTLLVLQQVAMGESAIAQSSVKLWSPYHAKDKPRALRLHEYPVFALAMSTSGSQAAFSDGSNIRVFDLQNIENEILKIRAAPDESVQAIAFRPNSTLLAAAYSNGKVVFWNLQTGQASLQLQAVPNKTFLNGLESIASMGFSDNGAVLHIAITDGRLFTYALDPSYIREVAQNEYRQLQAFSVEDIVRYNLEAALYYPGNFERLAESGDAPLVRAFFRHFRGQALESNNIEQVRDYCDRSLYLYERLSKSTQKHWRLDMQIMYEDYAWKLLLRNKISEATAIAKLIKNSFDFEPVLLNAHLALLRRDFGKASALYTQYLLADNNQVLATYEVRGNFDPLQTQATQLRDYELLDSVQVDCFCSTVALSDGFASFCPNGRNYPTKYRLPADQIRWEIFQNRDQASNTIRLAKQIKYLNEAQQKAKNLLKYSPVEGQAWLETVTLELAERERKWGVFEYKSPEALPHFERAVQLLHEIGPSKASSDTSRLALLASTHLAWGSYLLDAGKTREAIDQLNLGLEATQPLSEEAYKSDTSLLIIYYDNLVGPLFERIGTAYLLEGLPNEARQAYEQADKYYYTLRGLRPQYQATVSVFENDEVSAFLDFGRLTVPFQTSQAIFLIDRLAERFPEQRERLKAFVPRLREGLISKNPRLVNAEADYWLDELNIEYFAAQSMWDSALVWSRLALENAKRCMDAPKAEEIWATKWLDEHINIPYYMLLSNLDKPAALEECIRTVQTAEEFLAKEEQSTLQYNNRELLPLNLAHALVLRNKPGDREGAMKIYKHFLESNVDLRGYDNLDMLEKDIRDLKRAGVSWPELPPFGGGEER